MSTVLCRFQQTGLRCCKQLGSFGNYHQIVGILYIKSGKYSSRSSTTSANSVPAIRKDNQLYDFKKFHLSMEVSKPELHISDSVQTITQNIRAAVCESTDDDQGSKTNDDSFGLNMLFDMEKVVNEVKVKINAKQEEKQIQQNEEKKINRKDDSNKQKDKGKVKKQMNRKKSDESGQCLLKGDSDGDFGLTNLFEQRKTVHKRKRKGKKVNNVAKVKKMKEDDSFGLEMLFSEKNVCEKKSKQKRKGKMVEYDETASEEEVNEIELKKKRPNHFVAIRISNPKIHLGISDFQNSVLKENEKLKPALIPLVSLHITMAVMYLDAALVKIAQNALDKCKVKIMEALGAMDFKLTFSGVGNFCNEILFAKIEAQDQIDSLKSINSLISATLEEDGICLSDKKEWKPHLTLLKLSRKKSLRKSGVKKIEESVYASWIDSYFGEELVQDIHLCSMLAPKEADGFYKCLSTITFSSDSKNEMLDANVENMSME